MYNAPQVAGMDSAQFRDKAGLASRTFLLCYYFFWLKDHKTFTCHSMSWVSKPFSQEKHQAKRASPDARQKKAASSKAAFFFLVTGEKSRYRSSIFSCTSSAGLSMPVSHPTSGLIFPA